jgi:hypothetical protein
MENNKHDYIEAFCLMLYKCDKCGTIEILWNSRDGVTPFCIECRQCHTAGEMPTMSHNYFRLDTKKEDYKPFIGQKIFIGSPNKPRTIIFNGENYGNE